MIRVQHHLTTLQVARLRALSEKTGATVSEIVRRALDAYLEREEREAKKSIGDFPLHQYAKIKKKGGRG